MRRLSIIVCILSTLFAVAGTGTASAGSIGPVDNCYGETIRSASHVPPSGFSFGAVQLCQDSGGFFGVYINYNSDGTQGPMPYGQFANAWIYRYHNGVYYGRMSCDSGNGHVVPGETACFTPSSGVGAGVSFRARAFLYVLIDNSWVEAASAWTAPINA